MADITKKRAHVVDDECGSSKKRLYNDSTRERKCDVTIVVGGKEFREQSQFLCYISDYFNGALNSGMKETHTKHFEFPEKNPDEWTLLMAVMSPLPDNNELTRVNLEAILPWCSELCVTLDIVAKIDTLFCKKLFDNLVPFETECKGKITPDEAKKLHQNMPDLFKALEKAIEHQFPETLQKILEVIDYCLLNAPFEVFDAVQFDSIISLVRERTECRSALTSSLQAVMPNELRGEPFEPLLANGLLQKYIAIERRGRKIREYVTTKLPSELSRYLPRSTSVSRCDKELRQIVESDNFWTLAYEFGEDPCRLEVVRYRW